MDKELQKKDQEIVKLTLQVDELNMKNDALREETNLYKGRCTNLQRDIELHTSAVNKLSTDQGSMGDQINLYKNRITQMEEEQQRTIHEKSNLVFEVKKLTTEKEALTT